jgi:hypothetical protein
MFNCASYHVLTLQVGTPVTAESFAKWSIAKIARKQLEAEARVKAEQAKKKGGKGLCEYRSTSMIISEVIVFGSLTYRYSSSYLRYMIRCIVFYYIVFYGTVLYCIVLYSSAVYCIVLYCIVLSCDIVL